jgi:hypothetical protein
MGIRPGRLLRPAVMVGVLLAADTALAVGLVLAALAPRPVVVVPAARAEAELLPGAVPEAAAREFALRYVLHFDNFTPATIEASTETLRRMVAGRSWSGAAEALEKRRKLVVEGRMSSQSIPLVAAVEGLTVRVDAVRRTFIADKLSREARVRYVVVLERQPPTDPNPFGLAVVSQSIEEEEDHRRERGERRDEER